MFKKIQNKQFLLIFANLLFLFVSLSVTLFFWLSLPISAQESDALAIRIYRNANAYSALRWYNNEFPEDSPRRGTPQSIADVDGYRAIRDGRTVYVNAGNLVGGNYHSNIYTLGFSQNSTPSTMKVHADMLKHWTFNTNMLNPDNGDFGTCNISTMVCLSADDCRDGYECREHKCRLPASEEANLTCWRDNNCPKNIFCSGRKASVARQTKRYEGLSDIMELLVKFRDDNGYFPTLSSGTYISGVSLSTWPSWNDTLAKDINGGEFPIDPINTMGYCGDDRYDPHTCWDDVNKEFSLGNTANAVVNGPAGSDYYGYSADPGHEQIYSYSSTDGVISCDLNSGACQGL